MKLKDNFLLQSNNLVSALCSIPCSYVFIEGEKITFFYKCAVPRLFLCN